MPNRPAGNGPAGTIQMLGLPGRAVAALTRAGVTTVEDLAALSRRELAAIPGLGPGMIAAIRVAVPEPATGAGGATRGSGADGGDAEEESPTAPEIPSFASLRTPRRPMAVDVLTTGSPAAAPPPSAASSSAAARPARPASRPPDYADLLRLGVHAFRAAAGLPGRLARWSLGTAGRCLGRLVPGGPEVR